jgi:hypothetical protein
VIPAGQGRRNDYCGLARGELVSFGCEEAVTAKGVATAWRGGSEWLPKRCKRGQRAKD